MLKPKWWWWNAKQILPFSYLTFPVAFNYSWNTLHSPLWFGICSLLHPELSAFSQFLQSPCSLPSQSLAQAEPLCSPFPFHIVLAHSSFRSQLKYHFLRKLFLTPKMRLSFLLDAVLDLCRCPPFTPGHTHTYTHTQNLSQYVIISMFNYAIYILFATLICSFMRARSASVLLWSFLPWFLPFLFFQYKRFSLLPHCAFTWLIPIFFSLNIDIGVPSSLFEG